MSWGRIFEKYVLNATEKFITCFQPEYNLHNESTVSANYFESVAPELDPNSYNRRCVVRLIVNTLKQSRNNPNSTVGPGPCSAPIQIPNPKFSSPCYFLDRDLFKFVFPILIFLCVTGNGLNMLIYKQAYFRGATAVDFLRLKAVANLGFVFALLFEMIVSLMTEQHWNLEVERAYWYSRPYLLWLANAFGTIATWCTLCIVGQTFLCIWRPSSFKSLCNNFRTKLTVILSTVIAILLQLTPGISWKTSLFDGGTTEISHGNNSTALQCIAQYFYYGVSLKPGKAFSIYQTCYYYSHALCVLILPTFLMLFISLFVTLKYGISNLGDGASRRRKCVIRLTSATALSHLVLEGPSSLVFVTAAIQGSSQSRYSQLFCAVNSVTNFLTLVNATWPFFLYVICNDTFRKMAKNALGLSSASESSPGSDVTVNTTQHYTANSGQRLTFRQRYILKKRRKRSLLTRNGPGHYENRLEQGQRFISFLGKNKSSGYSRTQTSTMNSDTVEFSEFVASDPWGALVMNSGSALLFPIRKITDPDRKFGTSESPNKSPNKKTEPGPALFRHRRSTADEPSTSELQEVLLSPNLRRLSKQNSAPPVKLGDNSEADIEFEFLLNVFSCL